MAKIIETEMEGCLEQMAELQVKMERLQEEASKKAAEKEAAEVVTKIEPNLKIMSDWLYEYGEVIEESERDRVIIEQNKNVDDIIDREERKYIIKKYEAYREKSKLKNRNLNRNNRKVQPVPLHDSARQTYFTKLYIEGTHNMFLIQQKRINELEKKIEEINLKL